MAGRERRLDALANRALGLSGLWRSLSPGNPQHLAVGALSVAAAGARFAMGLVQELSPAEAAPAAVNTGVMLFLAWAVTREIDPDRPASALWAAGLCIPLLLSVSAPAGAMVALLFALRVASRSTGQAPTALDLIFLPLLSGAVAATPRGWVGGAAVAAALIWDSALPDAAGRRNLAAAAGCLAAALAAAAATGNFEVGFAAPGAVEIAAFALGFLGFLAARSYVPRSRQDRAPGKVSEVRMGAARRLAFTTALVAGALFGGDSVPLLAGLWTAFAGTGAYDRATRS